LALQSDVKSSFGTFYASGAALRRDERAHTYLKFFSSFLDSKKEDVLDILTDVMLNTVFDDDKEIMNTVLQAKSQLEDAIVSSGESVAISRAEAGNSDLGIIVEHMSGYEAYKVLKECCSDEEKAQALIQKVKKLYKKLITRERLCLCFAGEYDEAFVERLVSALPSQNAEIIPAEFPSCSDEKEFFVVPSRVAYAAMSAIAAKSVESLGFLRVARSILSYEYLWNTIRVKNGAYGAGFIPRRDGLITFYSYRDPPPSASIEIFKESGNYLREVAKSDVDLTKFIIGAIGEYDTLTTPKIRALLSTRDYLSGIPDDFEEKVRHAMLSMKKEDLLVCADILDCALENAKIAAVGGAEHLSAFDTEKMTVIEI
jgi:Zn-dependent M16 (insulinase) family peptidase